MADHQVTARLARAARAAYLASAEQARRPGRPAIADALSRAASRGSRHRPGMSHESVHPPGLTIRDLQPGDLVFLPKVLDRFAASRGMVTVVDVDYYPACPGAAPVVKGILAIIDGQEGGIVTLFTPSLTGWQRLRSAAAADVFPASWLEAA